MGSAVMVGDGVGSKVGVDVGISLGIVVGVGVVREPQSRPNIPSMQLHWPCGIPSPPALVVFAMQERHDGCPGVSWNDSTSQGKQVEMLVAPSVEL